jgi:WXG100 family type VII secretion target
VKPIRVKLDSIETGVTALQGTIDKIEARLNALEAEVQPMIQSWSGDARDEYLAQKGIWERAAADMIAALRDLTNSVSASHVGYNDLHRILHDAWQ